MIDYITENHCIGCDYCLNCGRDSVSIPVYICDECENKTEDRLLYKVNGHQLCDRCTVRYWIKNASVEQIEELIYNCFANEDILEKYEVVEEY